MHQLKGVYGFVIKTIALFFIIGRFLVSTSIMILRFIVQFFVLSIAGVLFVHFFTHVPENQVAIVAAIPLVSLLILEKIIQLLPIPISEQAGNASAKPMSQFVLGVIFVVSGLLAFVPFLSYFLYKWMHLNYLLPICAEAVLCFLGLSFVGFALMVIVTARALRVQSGRSFSSILLEQTATCILVFKHIFGSVFAENPELTRGVRP
jgi:hypothetical protein